MKGLLTGVKRTLNTLRVKGKLKKNVELGEKVLEHEKERIKELAFWEDVSELGSPSVYHFHPIAFVGNIGGIELAPWMEIAYQEEDVSERDRVNGGFDRVKEYYRDGAGQPTLHPIDNAWCSSFANWVLIETNKTKGTSYSYIPLNGHTNNPALAINFVNQGRYPGGRIIPANERPPYGAILVIKKRTGDSGHATFVISYTKDKDGFTIVALGGNQNHKVQVNSYKFIKVGNNYIYNNSFIHMGYVVPQEYHFNKDDERYYRYENSIADESSSIT